jgi:hypothetical protein
MTYETFSKWIDEQISKYEELEENEWMDEQAINSYLGKIEAFKAVKERFATLTPPPTTLS